MNRNKFFIYWLPVLIYAGIIFYLSSLPQPPKGIEVFPHFDKVLHLIEYAGFGFLIYRALVNAGYPFLLKNAAALAILIALCYGLSDECHQLFVPTRDFSLFDLFFDGLGAAAAVFILNRRQNPALKGADSTAPKYYFL